MSTYYQGGVQKGTQKGPKKGPKRVKMTTFWAKIQANTPIFAKKVVPKVEPVSVSNKPVDPQKVPFPNSQPWGPKNDPFLGPFWDPFWEGMLRGVHNPNIYKPRKGNKYPR